jgi:hypothetical protein
MELLAASCRQAVDTLSEVNIFQSNKYVHMRGNVNHDARSDKERIIRVNCS